MCRVFKFDGSLPFLEKLGEDTAHIIVYLQTTHSGYVKGCGTVSPDKLTLYLWPSTFFAVDTTRYSSSFGLGEVADSSLLPKGLGPGFLPRQREALQRLDLLAEPPAAKPR